MRKLVWLAAIALVSCREYRAIMSETTTYQPNRKMFFTDAGHNLLQVTMNGVPHQMFFDTGAAAMVVYAPKFRIDSSNILRSRKVFGYNREVAAQSLTYSAEDMTTEISKTQHKYLYLLLTGKQPCDSTAQFDGILPNLFGERAFELNYEEGFLRVRDSVPEGNWGSLDATFNALTGKFSVKLEVDGTSDYFLFDTGNKTMVCLGDAFKDTAEPIYSIRFISTAVGGKTIRKRFDVHQSLIAMNGGTSFRFATAKDSASTRSILSKGFISKFNWFVDAAHKKVYYQPIDENKLKDPKTLKIPPPLMLANVAGGKLVVSYTNHNVGPRLGTIITSVTGKQVTTENMCAMRDLLNAKRNWDSLRVTLQ